ncbi:MAG: DUF4493 domain-containing protein [Alistipes sp.]
MKTFNQIFTLIAAVLLATGCVNEDPAYKKGTEPVDPTETRGFLALNGLTMRVVYDTQTETDGDDTSGETERPLTRAEPNTDNFVVEIFDAHEVSVLKMTYAELKTAFAQPYPLEVGNYRMEIRSEQTSAAVAWDHPVYGTTKFFSILKAQTTPITEVVCTLQNIKVTLMCAVDLADKLTEDTQATVSLGDNVMRFVRGEKRAAYFMPPAAVNTLGFRLDGKFNDTQSPVAFSKTIDNVRAGQWRKITLVITYADKGNVKFDIKVENFVLDEEVVVNGTDNMWEEIFEDTPVIDPSAPVITWPNHDLSKPFTLKASMFNAEGKCTEPFALNLVSPNGIESMMVSISSTNLEFMKSLSSVNIPDTFDLCTINAAHPAFTLLKALGFSLGDELKGFKTKSFDLAGGMSMLYLAPGFDGTHTFAFTMTDANALKTSAALVVKVDRAAESSVPSIVWTDYDITNEYTLTADMKIDLVITAAAGIKKFLVTIDSDQLSAELPGMGIPIPFDLCDVSPELDKVLSGEFKFPTNDQVKNQTSLAVSITPFVKLLIGFPGKNNFIIAVTDNHNHTTTQTVQLKVL